MALWRGEERRGFEPALLLGVCFMLFGHVLMVFRQEIVRGCILSAVGAVIYVTGARTSRPPSNWSEPTRPLLICLEDSLTHGHCSASFVDRIVPTLQSRSEKKVELGVVNAGQNNICSWTIYHKRMEAALHCDPDYVLVMIGSNHVCGIYNNWWSIQRECMWQLPERPSLDGLETNVHGIMTTLLHHSPRLQVGLCTLPPMGEVLDQPTNQVARQANFVMSRIADSAGDRCTLVPVCDSLERSIRRGELGGWKPPTDYFLPLSIVMGTLHHVGGISWNTLRTS